MRYLHETFAEMLLDGETYQLEPDPVTEVGGSSYNGGSNKRFRAGKSKSGRKTRESKRAEGTWTERVSIIWGSPFERCWAREERGKVVRVENCEPVPTPCAQK